MATIIPAYGRDYKSKAEVLKHFDEDRDFKTQSLDLGFDQYISKSQLVGTRNLTIRYNKLQSIVVVAEVVA